MDKLLISGVKSKDLAVVNEALDGGANVNTNLAVYKSTPLFLAASSRAVDVLNRLLSVEGVDVAKANRFSARPVHAAAMGKPGTDNPAALDALVAAGANVNVADDKGQTPLMLACKCGLPNIAAALLKAGAVAPVKDKRGLSAEDHARLAKRDDIADSVASACTDDGSDSPVVVEGER